MKKKQAHFKLKTILVFVAAILIVLTLGISGLISFNMFEALVVKKIYNSRVDVLSQISEKITTINSNAEMISNMYFYNSVFDEKNIDRVFTEEEKCEIEKRFVELEGLNIMTHATTGLDFYYEVYMNNGYIYSSLDNTKIKYNRMAEFRNELWFSRLKEDSNIWTSTSYDYNGDPVVSNVRAIKDNDGEIIGLFMFNVYEENFRRQYNTLTSEERIYVVDKDGTIISHMNDNMIGIRFYDMDIMHMMFDEKNYNIIKKNGEDYLFSIYENNDVGWIIVEETPMKFLLDDINLIRLRMILMGFAVFICGMLVFLYIAKKTTKPLDDLVGELEKVARSEESYQEFKVKGWYEVDRISNECNYMNTRIYSLVEKIKDSEKKKRVAEMGFMQSQMSPHFLYNTLFSIRCLVDMEDKKGAIGIIDAFTSILKYILSYKSEFVDVSQEIKFLEDYAILQKYRYGEQFKLKINCPEELYQKKMLRMILEPLVENSIFHGMDEELESIYVNIDFAIKDSDMLITVTDNGVGFTEENFAELGKRMRENKQSNMIGMNNIRERIKMNFGENYTLSIDTSYEEGARVIVKIPVIE